ncbi:alpha/beta fold hydrolase [Halopseudomonas pelagia]|uniref:alpha/beta fold hydrolase n=1 Tax=Halopseudomonas pelagia TaxID=553151 RepID=UPI0003A96316|nr:alpha/beta fold hydrolase [Halopseudomonas pelagia]
MLNITLLPGWALAPTAMQPLAKALGQRLPEWCIQTPALPALQLSTLESDLAILAEQLPPGVLVGWSLGGMLAVQLQRRFPQRFSHVVTIASNACFVMRKDWAAAMPAETFKAFLNDFRAAPEKILKRFALLVAQGSEQPRTLAQTLEWDSAAADQRLHALALLGVLDSRAALKASTAASLHCFGGRDALVPVAAAHALAQMQPRLQVAIHDQAGHALPLEQSEWLAERIAGFLGQRDD